MYCLQCVRVTETENITTATSKKWQTNEARPMHHMWKTKTQFIKRDVTGGSFLNTLVNKLPFKMYLPGHNFTGPGIQLYKTLNSDGTPKE